MATHRQRFTGLSAEDFPAPPIARRLQPGDVVEYEADEPIEHARLELVPDEAPDEPEQKPSRRARSSTPDTTTPPEAGDAKE